MVLPWWLQVDNSTGGVMRVVTKDNVDVEEKEESWLCQAWTTCTTYAGSHTTAFVWILQINHRRAVAQHRINGDSQSQWRGAKFLPYAIETPWTDYQKIGTVDYVRETTRMPNLVQIRPRGASRQMHQWNITIFWNTYIYRSFLETHLQSDPLTDFHARLTTRFHARVCLWWLENLKLIFNPQKIPDTGKFGQKREKFFD